MDSPIRDELTVLAAFSVVADERSFTKAAIRLGVSRSAISHSIRTIVERLQLRLLSRTTRSVAPTVAGVRLLSRLRPALHDIQASLAEDRQLRANPAGTIRLITALAGGQPLETAALNAAATPHSIAYGEVLLLPLRAKPV